MLWLAATSTRGNARFCSASKLARECQRHTTDGATALVLTLWVTNATSGGAMGARRWQWKGKCHAMATASCNLDWSDGFFFELARRTGYKWKTCLVGVWASPKRMRLRGKFSRTRLVEEARRKKFSPWRCSCFCHFWQRWNVVVEPQNTSACAHP